MIEALVFDVDGVLVHGGQFGRRLVRELRLQREALDTFWQGPFVRCSLGLADLRHELRPFLARWGYPGSVDDCLQAWLAADSELNVDALAAIDRARASGLQCHLASNQERHRAAHLEGPLGLAARFDRRFFSCHLGARKPAPEFFERITEALSLAPSSLLFFDDQSANVDAARAAGWHAERFGIGDDLAALLARYGVASPGAPPASSL